MSSIYDQGLSTTFRKINESQLHTFFVYTLSALGAIEQFVNAMNYHHAKRQVLGDWYLKDLLVHLRRTLIKQPKPTIGEFTQILSEKIVECAIAKHRASMQTDFEFEKIDIMRYFPILWVILIEDYPEQCISEYALFEDEQIQECHKLLKNSCRQQYIAYIQNL